MKNVKRIFDTYQYLLKILIKDQPLILLFTVFFSILAGLCPPLFVLCNKYIIDVGDKIVNGEMEFASITPILILFLMVSILPSLVNLFIYNYIQPNAQLILRTSLRSKLIDKLKRLKFEHFENQDSIEIIDKAFNRTENMARLLFPMYLARTIIAFFSVIGSFIILIQAQWWLVLTVLIPFIIEIKFSLGLNFEIYAEMEKYWEKEYKYSVIGRFLSSREFAKENRLHQISDFLVDEYTRRQKEKNTEYEKFFLKHLRRVVTNGNLSRVSALVNATLLLLLFLNDQVTLGVLVSISLMLFGYIYSDLNDVTVLPRFGGVHANSFEYYQRFFDLSEDIVTDSADIKMDSTIEFKNVWFRYPGTDKYILKDISFRIEDGEKISIVGENGEGKTTIIKLILGLYSPDKGEILVGGHSINKIKELGQVSKIFGTVFQNFLKYNISLRENVSTGDLDKGENEELIINALKSVDIYDFVQKMPNELDTILGRQFDNGVDLSGGQWQRIAMARAVFGDKKILILDEPTSQLDPIAESDLYKKFAKISANKTTIFITHRLGSTAITDRILVVSEGNILQEGSHEKLINEEGLYLKMFNSQKHLYIREGQE